MVHLLELMVVVAGSIVITFLVLLALPQCKLRDMLMPWVFVGLCAAYALSPVDVLPEIALGPFGLVDDLAVAAAGIHTAMKTIRAGRRKHPNFQDPYFNN